MRKRTVRNGMRLLLAALLMIILASFYHTGLADLLSLSSGAEQRFYNLGIFWAAAMGGYGVVLAAFGLVLSPHPRDTGVRITPLLLVIAGVVGLFFYLLVASITSPPEERIRPGTTITI